MNPKNPKKPKKGRPTAEQLKAPRFKEQHTSTGKEQVNFRSSPEFRQLLEGIALALDLSEADVLRLSVFRTQRDIDKLKARPNELDMALMTRVVPEAAKFRLLLNRRPQEVTVQGIDLFKVLRDFFAMSRIEDVELRLQALDTLEQKLRGIFERIRAKAKLDRKEKVEYPLTTDLELL